MLNFMATESDRFFIRAEEVRAQSRLYRRQLLNWVALASAGGVAALLSFSANLHNADYTLRLLLPSLSAFVVALILCGAAVLILTRESSSFEWYYLFAAERELAHEEIAGPNQCDRSALAKDAADLHGKANWFDDRAKRLAKIGDAFVLFAAAMFIVGAGYPVTVILRHVPLEANSVNQTPAVSGSIHEGA